MSSLRVVHGYEMDGRPLLDSDFFLEPTHFVTELPTCRANCNYDLHKEIMTSDETTCRDLYYPKPSKSGSANRTPSPDGLPDPEPFKEDNDQQEVLSNSVTSTEVLRLLLREML
jgi:hypothetical protein